MALRPFKMTSLESEYSLSDEDMEAADKLMSEDQLKARFQPKVDTEYHTDLVSLLKHVTQVLESFYTREMRGWRKNHALAIDTAAGATGLAQSQIEVSMILINAS